MTSRLERFIEAQASVYEQVLSELAAGHKRTHWMWFVFPQLKALGRSSTARLYGLNDLAEAQAYDVHPVLGARLRQCVRTVLGVPTKSAHSIFGSPDDLKFCSCLTLFERAAPYPSCFTQALLWFYGGQRDCLTLELIENKS